MPNPLQQQQQQQPQQWRAVVPGGGKYIAYKNFYLQKLFSVIFYVFDFLGNFLF